MRVDATVKVTARQFVLAAKDAIETATLLLMEEGVLTHPSVIAMMEKALKATGAADLVRRTRAALAWAVRRLTASDASELLLDTLREVLGHPLAA